MADKNLKLILKLFTRTPAFPKISPSIFHEVNRRPLLQQYFFSTISEGIKNKDLKRQSAQDLINKEFSQTISNKQITIKLKEFEKTGLFRNKDNLLLVSKKVLENRELDAISLVSLVNILSKNNVQEENLWEIITKTFSNFKVDNFNARECIILFWSFDKVGRFPLSGKKLI